MKKPVIALISQVSKITFPELTQAAAALQKQVNRDFAPFWRKNAKVKSYKTIKEVPVGAWPIIIRKKIEYGMGSYHSYKNGIPYAFIMYDNRWTQFISHEMLEMLVDPFGTHMISGMSIKPGEKKEVSYLMQVCDPCADVSYQIDGILVSDFCTPDFFQAGKKNGARYDYASAISHPFQVLKNCYMSWYDPKSKHWWQYQYFESKPRVIVLDLEESETEAAKPRQRIRTFIQMQQYYAKRDETREEQWKDEIQHLISRFKAAKHNGKTSWRELTPKNIDDLYRILNCVSDSQLFVFRGHASNNWKHLVTSLHRTLGKQGISADQAKLEAEGITAFRRHGRSLLHYSELVYFDRILHGITLMQHYGAPTRLLDWTFSPWVAAYFVVSEHSSRDEDGVIWAFNQVKLLKEFQFNAGKPAYQKFEALTNAVTIEEWLQCSLKQSPVIKIFRYQYANPQMGAQQSIFTICGKINEYHETALERALPDKWDKLKIIIPSVLKNTLRQRLFRMNVSALSLFPTVSGVGLHISEAIRCGFALGDDGLLYQAEKKIEKK